MSKFFLIALSSLFALTTLIGGNKIRVLYILSKYPQMSETYAHEELASVWDDYNVKIVSLRKPNVSLQVGFPHILLNDKIKEYRKLTNADWKKLDEIIQEFQPDVLHSHWFFNAPILARLAEKHNIPFTIRCHSFDMLEAKAKTHLKIYCRAANSTWCKRVLCFPGHSRLLRNNGLEESKIMECWPVINYQRFYQPEKKEPTGRIMNAGPCLKKRNHTLYVDFAHHMHNNGFHFDLYAIGYETQRIHSYNNSLGNPIDFIGQVEPEEMPDAYRSHDWLIFMVDKKLKTVGLPIIIAEAQASGLGVCFQEIPGRKDEQLAYLGGAGFLFNSIEELPEILSKPYPEHMRIQGLKNAKKCDIEEHKHLLTDVWDSLKKKS